MNETFKPYLPLVVFTTLMPLAVAAGVGAATLGLASGGTTYDVETFSLAALGIGLAAVTASLLHLGRGRRAPLALVGLGRSWLSREVLLASGFVGLTAVTVGLARAGPTGDASRLSAALAALAGIGTVFAIGRVYHLPGHVGWRGGPRVFGPIASTLLLAAMLYRIVADGGVAEMMTAVVLILAAVDLLLATRRLLDLSALIREQPASLTFPTLAEAGVRMLAARCVLTGLALLVVLLAPPPWRSASLPLQIVALILDRLAFYAGTARRTPRVALEAIRRERMDRAAEGETETERT